MGKTFIIYVSSTQKCDVEIYDGDVTRDIEKSIDLSEGLIKKRKNISIEAVANLMKSE